MPDYKLRSLSLIFQLILLSPGRLATGSSDIDRGSFDAFDLNLLAFPERLFTFGGEGAPRRGKHADRSFLHRSLRRLDDNADLSWQIIHPRFQLPPGRSAHKESIENSARRDGECNRYDQENYNLKRKPDQPREPKQTRHQRAYSEPQQHEACSENLSDDEEHAKDQPDVPEVRHASGARLRPRRKSTEMLSSFVSLARSDYLLALYKKQA